MKTLMFRKIRLGWELVLDGKVIAHKVTATARGDILLIAVGVIHGFEANGISLKVDDHLTHVLKEKGYWWPGKEKAPHTT